MSGRQQHYLPQFLQRQFSVDFQNNGRRCVKVFRHGITVPIFSSTNNIGKERDFYGHENKSSADETITRMESELANIIKDACSADKSPTQSEFAKLVAIQSIRSKAIRNALSGLAPKFLEFARDASSNERLILTELSRQTQYKELLKIILREYPNFNEFERNLRAKYLQIERMKIIHKRKDNVAHIKSVIDEVMNMLFVDASAIADTSYLKIFEDDSSSLSRIQSFERFIYKVIRIDDDNQFILGDCSVIALDGSGRARLAVSDIDEEVKIEEIYFPISPNTCIYGSLSGFEIDIDVNKINSMASSLSLEFFISPIMNDKINQSLVKLIRSEIEPIIAIQELQKFANEFI